MEEIARTDIADLHTYRPEMELHWVTDRQRDRQSRAMTIPLQPDWPRANKTTMVLTLQLDWPLLDSLW